MSQHEWSRYERGLHDPNISTYLAMEHVLDREVHVPLAFDVECTSTDPVRRMYIAIASSIRQKRKLEGLSIHAAAERALISPNTWWRVETYHDARLNTVLRMAMTVGVAIVIY